MATIFVEGKHVASELQGCASSSLSRFGNQPVDIAELTTQKRISHGTADEVSRFGYRRKLAHVEFCLAIQKPL